MKYSLSYILRGLPFEEKVEEFMHSQHKNILDDIEDSKDISDETEKKLEEAITSFKGTISY